MITNTGGWDVQLNKISIYGTRLIDPLHFGMDLDPDTDPRIHASNKWIRIQIWLFSSLTFKTPAKKYFFCKVFLHITF